MPIRTDIVVVTYNSADVLETALSGLSALPDSRLVIVDNASADNSAEIARRHADEVITLPGNAGFGTACNVGAHAGEAELILFINPDAAIDQPALARLLAAAEAYPDTGAFNPQLINPDGSPYRRGAPVAGSKHPAPEFGRDGEVDVLSGAALLCRRAAFDEIGGFDEQIFLFFEDDDLSIRLQAAGWRLRQVGEAEVTHLVGKSSRPSVRLGLMKERAFARAQLYVATKHGRPLPAGRLALKSMLRLLQACLLFDRARAIRNLGRLQGYLKGP